MRIPITLAIAAALAGPILAHPGPDNLQSVTQTNPRVPGQAQPNTWSLSLAEIVVARGAIPLENPTTAISHYGYLNNGTMLPAPGSVQSPGNHVEASKTEPDKNTYLVLAGQKGADPDYDYGHHFLFQGHETGAGYITRINLDADQTHRVTLLADADVNGVPLPLFDGSTWYPWSKHLLFTSENGARGGVMR